MIKNINRRLTHVTYPLVLNELLMVTVRRVSCSSEEQLYLTFIDSRSKLNDSLEL